MAPIIPDPGKIKSFRTEAAFAAWMKANHARETELWLKIHKKGSGLPTVTAAQALDVALCWGWIDGIRKSFDDQSFLQRYTPRRARSIWSQINRDHVARLTAAGRMTPHGQRQVDAARADGRWDAAYAPIRSASEATIPEDLRAAIEANPRARKTFRTLGRHEPVRAGVSDQQHENAGRTREEDRGAGRHARARRDDRPGNGREPPRPRVRRRVSNERPDVQFCQLHTRMASERRARIEALLLAVLAAALSGACARPALRTVPVVSIDTLDYVLGDGMLWPRIGTQFQHQIADRARREVCWVKYGDARKFECWRWDDRWIYHEVDHALDGDATGRSYSFSDGRWLPRHLAGQWTLDAAAQPRD